VAPAAETFNGKTQQHVNAKTVRIEASGAHGATEAIVHNAIGGMGTTQQPTNARSAQRGRIRMGPVHAKNVLRDNTRHQQESTTAILQMQDTMFQMKEQQNKYNATTEHFKMQWDKLRAKNALQDTPKMKKEKQTAKRVVRGGTKQMKGKGGVQHAELEHIREQERKPDVMHVLWGNIKMKNIKHHANPARLEATKM